CGEYSFVVPNITQPGRVCTEIEFRGCNAYSGIGQIAGMSFASPRWIDVEGKPHAINVLTSVIPISHDEVCVYWRWLRHVSNFKRVVDDFTFWDDDTGDYEGGYH